MEVPDQSMKFLVRARYIILEFDLLMNLRQHLRIELITSSDEFKQVLCQIYRTNDEEHSNLFDLLDK